jgi:protein-S-isoprenylcysteine O-methyltransferase Ste14
MNTNSDAPNVKIIPPLIYFAGLVIGLLLSFWMPTKLLSSSAAWVLGAFFMITGGALAGSAIFKFESRGTTIRPDRAASSLVMSGPYKITRNPMYLGLALLYFGIAIAEQSLWALILLPLVLIIIQRKAIEPEEAFLERRFGAEYTGYKASVRRWL